ncbi:MAG TPA: universal stress protein [Burkholderiales bacterium]
MFRKILVPTDNSALSRKAVKAAMAFARIHKAKVIGFHATERFEVLAYGEYFPPDLVNAAEWDKRVKRVAEKVLALVEKEARAAKVACETLQAPAMSPWEGIVEAARKKKCDLIFMASHGRTGLGGLLLGSQASKVLSHSKMPVLIFK